MAIIEINTANFMIVYFVYQVRSIGKVDCFDQGMTETGYTTTHKQTFKVA